MYIHTQIRKFKCFKLTSGAFVLKEHKDPLWTMRSEACVAGPIEVSKADLLRRRRSMVCAYCFDLPSTELHIYFLSSVSQTQIMEKLASGKCIRMWCQVKMIWNPSHLSLVGSGWMLEYKAEEGLLYSMVSAKKNPHTHKQTQQGAY